MRKSMKTFLNLLVVSSLLIALIGLHSAPKADAHPERHGPSFIDGEQATYNAQMMKESLVEEKKLESSWLLIRRESAKVTKRTMKGREEWMVTFVNEKVKDPAKRTLYVFFTLTGQFVVANHTGS